MTSVGVVIPTRNRIVQLQTALRSVLAQTRPVDQVVVVDEASSDGTADFLAALQEREPRLCVIRNDEPVFLPSARNQGVQRLETDLVAFLDDDDAWAPEKLDLQLDAMARRGGEWSISGALWFRGGWDPVRAQRPPTDESFTRRILLGNCVPGGGSTALVPRSALHAVGGFDPRLRYMEDWGCWVALSESLGAPSAVDLPLTAYRIQAGQMSDNTTELMESHALLVEKHRVFAQTSKVEMSPAGTMEFAAGKLLKRSDGSAARAIYRDLRQLDPSPRWLLKQCIASWPRGAVALSGARFRMAIPREWIWEAEMWLTQLMQLEARSERDNAELTFR
jgi:hypothetical protein